MLKIIHILSCLKEIICFEYALFVKHANVDMMFGCHGNMYLDNLFVNLILVLITRYWLIKCV